MAEAATKTLEETRCRKCRRLLLKVTPDALKPGAKLEVKCGSCNSFNFLIGVDADVAVST